MRLSYRRTRLAIFTLATALAAAAAGAGPVNAQSRPQGLPPEFSSDSTAWQRVLAHVVEVLSGTIVRTSADPSPQPWHIRLPSDEPQSRLLEAQLRTILRAREPVASDTVAYTLVMGPLRVVNDTAHVIVEIDLAQRCPGTSRVGGYHNTDSVYVPRAPEGFWGVARTAGVRHGDRFPCPRSGR